MLASCHEAQHCPSTSLTHRACPGVQSFLDLDRATLNIISENARYNAACTKEPAQRTRDDLQMLQQRTAHLSHISSLSAEVQYELCRVMRYSKVNENAILVRKGNPASCLYVLISGSAATYPPREIEAGTDRPVPSNRRHPAPPLLSGLHGWMPNAAGTPPSRAASSRCSISKRPAY